MGDEGYAQIQYPYTDADNADTIRSKDIAQFSFIDNEDNSNLNLLQPLSAVTNVETLRDKEWLGDLSAFGLYQRAQFATIQDLISDEQPNIAVFKNVGVINSLNDIIKDNGFYVKYATKVSNNGDVIKYNDDLIFNENAWNNSAGINVNDFVISNNPISYYSSNSAIIKGYKTQFTIPNSDTLNGENVGVTAYFTEEFVKNIISAQNTETSGDDLIYYKDIFNYSSFFAGSAEQSTAYCNDPLSAVKIQFRDWDDVTNKTYYVLKEDLVKTNGSAVGIQFREYGYNTNQEALAGEFNKDEQNIIVNCKQIDTIYNNNTNHTPKYPNETGIETVTRLADEYGVDVSQITSNKISLLTYYDVWAGIPYNADGELDLDYIRENIVEKLVYTDEWNEFKNKNGGKDKNEFLFWLVANKDDNKPITVATYVQDKPDGVVIPWQESSENVGDDKVKPIIAHSTSEILNSTNEKYKDGYTISIESDDEPGNGDIEQYSDKNNQLIITSIGPGEYGNDIGISIITTEAANIPALNHQNAFNWKYRFDDEDKVDDPNINPDSLTWTKVYRINVYVKNKSQTAESAWGTGMDALLRDPVEWFYVSNDPTAKDNEGNSLYAPNVINGISQYIYVSRNSVNEAKTGVGTYAQPHQTYSIYALTGGTNSKKNNITEKTAALKLYNDRQKADFDILFNVEAIETFNGRQRYGAMQRKIAEIAANRKLDIGVVQLTSKESKSVKKMIGETKMFAFNNGDYVAPYCNYDKYYNSTLGSWIYLPKSIAGACAMAYCDMFSYPWMAPAGVARGKIQYTTGQLSRLTDDEIGQLYDNNVNTSRQCGGFGEVLWGQKTALKKESALNRINVRRCLNYIEKQLENMLVPYLFQQNTPNTRSAAKNSIDAFLSRVQAAEGIIQYNLSVTQDTEDPHIMNVFINLIPAEAIEFINIKITVNRNTGVIAEEI